VGHRYGRARLAAVASMIAGLLVLPATALAADAPPDVLLDGVVTVLHVDAADGPIAGATITISTYRDPESPIQVLSATTDGDGRAQVSGVARAADGAAPVLIDVRSDLAATLVNAAGCSETASWSAMASTTAASSLELVLDSTAKSVVIDCPQPEPLEPTVAPQAPGGGVLAATGRPQITPPATDASAPRGQGSPSGLGGVVAAMAVVGLAALVAATVAGRRRQQPR
jgi:hypothetical protein